MSGRIERLETWQEMQKRLRAQPDGVQRTDEPRGWEMTAGDLAWAVTMVPGLFSGGLGYLAARARRQHVVVDAGAWQHHEPLIRSYYESRDIDHAFTIVPGGEDGKTLERVGELADALVDRRIGRADLLVGIGGGAVLDTVRLTASLYRRGIGCAVVPTTLLACVDAAVGLKTGVNRRGAKNLLGDYSGSVTLIDTDLMMTVDRRQMRSGISECLKMGVVADAALVAAIDMHGQALIDRVMTRGAAEMIARAVDAMVTELQSNPREVIKQRPADFGHAFGPILEMETSILHGESVAVDMATMFTLAMHRGRMPRATRDDLLSLMRRLGLPTWHEAVTHDLLSRALDEVTRHRGGSQNLPLASGTGHVAGWVHDVTPDELWEAAQETRDWQPEGGAA